MDFCNKCGGQTDPDWVFCRSCGNSLDDREIEDATSAQLTPRPTVPKVELISRGWDVVDVESTDVDTIDIPVDPLGDDYLAAAVAPGTVEISIDDVTVVEQPEEEAETEPAEAESEAQAATTTETEPAAEVPSDAWDHLRPHGQVPAVIEPSRVPAQVGQVLAAIASGAALVSSVLYLILNVQIERYGRGETSEQSVADVRAVAEASLLVLAGLVAIALIGLAWWLVKAYPSGRFRPGPAGMIAAPAFLGGAALIGFFAGRNSATVADDLTANSLVVLGLGLLMLAGLTIVLDIGRTEARARR